MSMIRVLNEENRMHPINAVAEYCFGMLCEDHYKELKSKEAVEIQEWMDKLIPHFKKAIELGLTHEMSLSGGPESEEIWAKVEAGL